MADFKTHISTSCAIGALYGLAGYYLLDLSAPACLLSAGFCGVAGMLPDLDSDTGVPLRETLAFGGACVSLLMMERWRQLGFTPESMALAGMITYLVVRFGFGEWLRSNTVHRGMFHSLPAAALAGLITFLVCHTSEIHSRLFKTSAIVLGFLIHLTLDEIWAVDFEWGMIRLKKSFGTAMKFWGPSPTINLGLYAAIGLLGWVAYEDPHWMQPQRVELAEAKLPSFVERFLKPQVQLQAPGQPQPSAPNSFVNASANGLLSSEPMFAPAAAAPAPAPRESGDARLTPLQRELRR